MTAPKTKQEKRQLIARKLNLKQKMGATLSTQLRRIKTNKKYSRLPKNILPPPF